MSCNCLTFSASIQSCFYIRSDLFSKLNEFHNILNNLIDKLCLKIVMFNLRLQFYGILEFDSCNFLNNNFYIFLDKIIVLLFLQ